MNRTVRRPPLQSVHPRCRQDKWREQPVEIVDGAAADQRQGALQAPLKSPQQGQQRGGNPHVIRLRRDLQERAVDVEE